MGIVNISKQQLGQWLVAWHEGTLPFSSDDIEADAYMNHVGSIDKSRQMAVAHDLLRQGTFSKEDVDIIQAVLDEEYPDFEVKKSSHLACFSAFKVLAKPGLSETDPHREAYEAALRKAGNCKVAKAAALKAYTDAHGIVKGQTPAPEPTTSKSKRKKKAKDPLRQKNGAFAFDVGQLWFYDPRNGRIDQRPFVGKRAIAMAFSTAAEIQSKWDKLGVKVPCAWVKQRLGNRRKTADGQEAVVMVDSKGYAIRLDQMLQVHRQALAAGISSPVGEMITNMKAEEVLRLLDVNTVYGVKHDLRFIDIPVSEGAVPKNEIVYSIKYLRQDPRSGDRITRLMSETPLPDLKEERTFYVSNEDGTEITVAEWEALHPKKARKGYTQKKKRDGKVLLAGHKARAYSLLLGAPSSSNNSPATVRYAVFEGTTMVEKAKTVEVTWDEAFLWEHRNDPLYDSQLKQLSDGFGYAIRKGTVTDAMRQAYMTARWTRLQEIDPDDEGKLEGKEQWQEALYHMNEEQLPVLDADGNPKLDKDGNVRMRPMLADRQYEQMANWNHPSFRDRSGPVLHQPKTNLDYHENGEICNMKVSSDGGPGYNWVGNMSSLEVQLYNCPRDFKF